jgi:hypothetical protein
MFFYLPIVTWQVYDDIRNGWCFMAWWLEVRDMALQQAGGPGPAAVEAALQLVNTMPHRVPLIRYHTAWHKACLASHCAHACSVFALQCSCRVYKTWHPNHLHDAGH